MGRPLQLRVHKSWARPELARNWLLTCHGVRYRGRETTKSVREVCWSETLAETAVADSYFPSVARSKRAQALQHVVPCSYFAVTFLQNGEIFSKGGVSGIAKSSDFMWRRDEHRRCGWFEQCEAVSSDGRNHRPWADGKGKIATWPRFVSSLWVGYIPNFLKAFHCIHLPYIAGQMP